MKTVLIKPRWTTQLASFQICVIPYMLLMACALWQCVPSGKTKKEPTEVKKNIVVPAFHADSAYHYVARQVAFGPRVPGTRPHGQAAQWIIATLKRFQAQVIEQDFVGTIYDGKSLPMKNIIASFNAQATKRLLLCAHWDTRPFADDDKDKKDAPMDGANDGASGVGVLLEIARQLAAAPPSVGVDIILFDGEDWGEKTGEKIPDPPRGSWWCLGSQYWAKHKHVNNYMAFYGVLLDMVGAKKSQFFREGASRKYAPGVVDKIWSHARAAGFGDYFVKQDQGQIVDDHVFINEQAHIPTIDIVHYQPGVGYFGDYHHTTRDNMDIISKETLNAVGSTLLRAIYYEE